MKMLWVCSLAVSLLVGGPPVPAADNGTLLSWKTLAEVGEVTVKDRVLPRFSESIVALDQHEVKLQGFMLPLDPGKMQKRFLLSANVPTCPFCLPGGPESLIEVLCSKPIAFTAEPIVVTGTLSVLRADPNGLWYRIKNASLVSTAK